MTQQEIIFRCPVCGEEVNIPVTEFDQVPVCENDRRIMQVVGGTGEQVNLGVTEIMTGMTRLAAAALTQAPGTGPLDPDKSPPPERD
jgi:hypothetical protein